MSGAMPSIRPFLPRRMPCGRHPYEMSVASEDDRSLLVLRHCGRHKCHIFKVVPEGFDDCTANRSRPLQFLSGLERAACPVPVVPSAVGVGVETWRDKCTTREGTERHPMWDTLQTRRLVKSRQFCVKSNEQTSPN